MLFSLIFSLILTSARAEQNADVAAVAADSQVAIEEVDYFLCRLGKNVRTLRVKRSGEFCRTFYMKRGVEDVLARGQEDRTCYEVSTNIKNNLVKGGWNCQAFAKDKISIEVIE